MSNPAENRHDSMQVSDQTDRKSRALYALLELSKALSSKVDLDDLLRVIVEGASSVVEAERTSIYVYDPLGDRLWSRKAQGLESATIELAVGSGVAGDVARTMRLSNIEDAYRDPRFNAESDARTGYRTRSILTAPVMDSNGKLLGVIQSLNKTTAARFDEQDESLMLALASHAAAAMERAALISVHLDNERLEEQLKVANEIQLRMLPHGSVTLPVGSPFGIHAHIRPARRVGGDLYDFFWNVDRLYFCIGDVSGKGVGAALVMALTKTLFRANAPFHEDPARLMAAVNARLYEETDSTMFVTAFCGFLDLHDGQLLYSNAGHDRPLILAAGRAPRMLESKPGLALGVFPQFTYPLQHATLAPGEAIFLYTDGVTDAADRSEQLFSLARVCQSLESGITDPTEAVNAVLEGVDRFAGNAQQADDIAMLCVCYRGEPRPAAPEAGEEKDPSSVGHGRAVPNPVKSREVSGSFPRDMLALDDVFRLSERFFSSERIGSAMRYAINLALEEVFTNMVKYNPDGKSEIGVRLNVRDGEAVVVLTDFDAPRFDINTEVPAVNIDQPLEARSPGGLGIHLVRKMMDRVEYRHENRTGTITLYKSLE